jgi:hypothetical protein
VAHAQHSIHAEPSKGFLVSLIFDNVSRSVVIRLIRKIGSPPERPLQRYCPSIENDMKTRARPTVGRSPRQAGARNSGQRLRSRRHGGRLSVIQSKS